MSRGTPAGRAIADQTRELARELARARARCWAAVLARPQLCGPVVLAICETIETSGWGAKLRRLPDLARAKVRTRRVADARAYRDACWAAGEWLAGQDRDCRVVDACADAIALWSGRQLPSDHRWAGERIYPARTSSRTWREYWREVEQARRSRTALRNQIVTLNEGLVIHYVQTRAQWMIRDAESGRSVLDRQDLHQHAREGLMVAASRFDPELVSPKTQRRIQFSTYATWWMRHHVDRAHQRDAAQIRVPLAVQLLCYRLSRALDRRPEATPEQLAEALWLERARKTSWAGLRRDQRARELAKVEDAMATLGWTYQSLDAPVARTEGRTTFADSVPSTGSLPQDEQIDQDRIAVRLLAALEGLDPESREVLRELYGMDDMPPKTDSQIARDRRIPADRVRQIHRQALAQMREQIGTATA